MATDARIFDLAASRLVNERQRRHFQELEECRESRPRVMQMTVEFCLEDMCTNKNIRQTKHSIYSITMTNSHSRLTGKTVRIQTIVYKISQFVLYGIINVDLPEDILNTRLAHQMTTWRLEWFS